MTHTKHVATNAKRTMVCDHDAHHGTRAESPFAPIAITGGVLADETMQLLRTETADQGARRPYG
jgi:hypothetical protein